MEIGERIARWREFCGLTQVSLAARLTVRAALADRPGVSPSAVAQWELGATTPTTYNMGLLATELAGSLHRFWGKPPQLGRRRAA